VNVLVYGLGRSGGAVARLLRRQGHAVWTFDAHHPQGEDLAVLGCRATEAPLEVPAELCVAAPGVPWDAPDLAALRARGVETVGEVEWVYRTVDAPILGVTGTAGKTTVTRWLSHTLTQAGLDAPAGGNVDPALAAVAAPGRVLVAELSSFQLERCPTLHPRVAVVLNLGRDHLDRHGSLAAYHAAKHHLVAHLGPEDTFVYNHDDPRVRAWAEASPARTWGFSASATSGVAAHLAEGTLTLHGRPLLKASALQLTGHHHQLNALAVALAAAAWGLEDEAIRAGLTSFSGVPGRYSFVGEVGGVRFVEDSIATRALAVQAALAATPAPVVWLLGGQDKGASFAELEPLVRDRVVLAVCFGEAGPAFAAQLSAWTETLVIRERSGEAALRLATALAAERLRGSGGTVLLAPLAASFDQFSDYQARAEAFRRAVAALHKPKEALWTGCSSSRK
jgi:UDP-N-acetylmuramoylalanine--D-glutamate ligase